MAGPKLSAAEIRLLYEQHGAALLLYARSFVADASAGEDLVHEVFLKLLRGDTEVPDIAPLGVLVSRSAKCRFECSYATNLVIRRGTTKSVGFSIKKETERKS